LTIYNKEDSFVKKHLLRVLIVTSLLAMTACGKDGSVDGTENGEVISTGNKELKDAIYTNDWVSLASYDDLSVEKKVYEVTQDAVDAAIAEELDEYTEYKTVDRDAAAGDWVCVDYTAAIGDEVSDEEEDYYFELGEQEFGAEFEEHLMGVHTGDELSFSVTYADEDEDAPEDWVGQTVDFTLTVTSVEEEVVPECTDEFTKENLGYDTYAEFEASIRESLQSDYEEESESELRETLVQQMIDNSSILKYTQADYDTASASVEAFYSSYADTFGTDLESIYDMFGITEENLKEDTLNAVYRSLVIQAVAEQANISIGDAEYEDGVARYMEYYEYDSEDDFVNDYGEDALRQQLLEDAVVDLLEEKAQITEVTATYEEE
jgi:trigger factor